MYEDEFPIITPKKNIPFKCEWGGTIRGFIKDGRIINLADELNRLERIKEVKDV